MYESLYETYNSGFEPPYWVRFFIFDRKERERSICYYDLSDRLSRVKEIERKREPVNIAMNRYYDPLKLQKFFGYQTSSYDSSSPNIAVYCYTPCIVEHKPKIYIHVLNVIAVALDSKKQPDFKRIQERGLPEYVKMVWRVFKKIRHCFISKDFNILVIHGFGLGVFSSYAKALNIDPVAVFKMCFENLFADLAKTKKIILNYLDLPTQLKVIKIEIPIQELVFKMKTKNEQTLYVNAWDPFSIIGNGNSKDNSLDGYFGRMTAMSVLGWSMTNPKLRFESVF